MKRYKTINIAGLASAIGLAGLPVFFSLSPMFGVSDANAEVTETLGTSATINSTLGLSANSINLVINPSSESAVFKTGQTIATVSTNNETGYTLYLSDSDSDNALKHKNLADKAIVSTETTATGENMLPNTWGYTLGNSEAEAESEVNNETNLALAYSPIPTTRTTIKKTDIAVANERTYITFGVKVNTEIPSGVYSDQVSITAIPNYNTTAYPNTDNLWLSADGTPITTMQEMTHDICASVPTPLAFIGDEVNADVPQTTLTDARDGNTYLVRKLADGNCWMSQNLKLAKEETTYPGIDGMEDGVLEATYTDMTSGTFELPVSQTEKSGVAWANSYTQAHIYKDTENTYYVNGLTKKTGTDGEQEYYQGNYYNFYTATLNSLSGEVSGDAPNTICPKNWTLPLRGNLSNNQRAHVDKTEYATASTTGFNSANKNSYSFTNLAQVYRMAYMNNWDGLSGTALTYNKNATLRMVAAPLSFPRSGIYSMGANSVGKQTEVGHYWSASSVAASDSSNIRGSGLDFMNDRVITQYSADAGEGQTIRCVAR